jgi:hypothetical protein
MYIWFIQGANFSTERKEYFNSSLFLHLASPATSVDLLMFSARKESRFFFQIGSLSSTHKYTKSMGNEI